MTTNDDTMSDGRTADEYWDDVDALWNQRDADEDFRDYHEEAYNEMLMNGGDL